ncbi:hypothetical protein AGMMS4957_15840 [Bacteroidia bacterium]|nr:hypothetical protein AGMMS4957_15840 [Bacteroidia bacterium]
MGRVKSNVRPFYKRGNAKFSIVLLGMAYMFWFLINLNDPNKGHHAAFFGYELWSPVPFPFYLVFLPIRMWAAVWVSRVVVTLNRSSFIWAIFAFTFPIVALCAVNYLEKDQNFSAAKSKWRIFRRRINRTLAVLTGVAMVAVIISILLDYNYPHINYFRRVQTVLLVVALKIGTVTWVRRLAFGQNRNHTYWGLAACLCSSLSLIAIGFLPKIVPKALSAPRSARLTYKTIMLVLSVCLLVVDLAFLNMLRYDDWYGPEEAQRNELAYRDMGERRIRVYQGKRCGAIDIFGRRTIPCWYQFIGSFSKNGLAPVKQFDKWGYIEKNGTGKEGIHTGKPIILCEYEAAEPFDDVTGLARVKMFGSEEWEYIDRFGELLVPIGKDAASPSEAPPTLPADTILIEELPTEEEQPAL